jgi:hypothetical protein
MERRAENPVPDFLVVDDDARFREESNEAIRDAELRGGLPAILCSSGAPKVELGSICLEASDMLNDGSYGNSGRARTANEGVININVNNHGVDVMGAANDEHEPRKAAATGSRMEPNRTGCLPLA